MANWGLRYERDGDQIKRDRLALRDLQIRRYGPQFILPCQVIDQIAKIYAEPFDIRYSGYLRRNKIVPANAGA